MLCPCKVVSIRLDRTSRVESQGSDLEETIVVSEATQFGDLGHRSGAEGQGWVPALRFTQL
jgi:hypothetical protein